MAKSPEKDPKKDRADSSTAVKDVPLRNLSSGYVTASHSVGSDGAQVAILQHRVSLRVRRHQVWTHSLFHSTKSPGVQANFRIASPSKKKASIHRVMGS